MAQLNVAVSSRLTPEDAWALASDLHRFDEWLTIFGGWRSEVPDTIEQGTAVSSCIRVKGFRNTIHWKITTYAPPQCIEMTGKGFGGVRIALVLTITGNTADDPESTFTLKADLSGGVLSGPVGAFVARVLKKDVRRSVENLARLQKAAK